MKKAASDATSQKTRKKSTADPITGEGASKPPSPKPRRAAKKSAPAAAPAAVGATLPEPMVPASHAAAAPAVDTRTLTVVAARVDIGFGNHLFLRGTGPGLNWDIGVPMVNVGSDLWTIDLMGATAPIVCKFLINDECWSAGPDYVVDPGAQLEVTPLF
ncbi:MAG: hypothetical protein ACKV19_22720 [Verrucomicrobiales bacterium]